MKRKILWLGLSFLMVAALVLASCGPAPVVEEPVVVEPVVEEPVVEEVKVLGFPRSETLIFDHITGPVGAPSNFNVWAGWRGRDRGLQNLAWEALWTNDYTARVIHNSSAASPPSYSEDMSEVTFYLREGVYWSDGVEFTADDVVFTIETVKAIDGLGFHAQMLEVERVYAADKYTVVVELYEPNGLFHTYFIDRWGTLFIMPKHIFEPVAAGGSEAFIAFEFNPPVGTGPYKLHSFDPAGFWTAWVRRDDWERTPTGMLFGQPGPKYVVAQDFPDETAMVMAMVRHELDSAFITIEPIKAVLGADPYAVVFRPGWPWIEGGHPMAAGVTFNTMKPPFDNKEVRWALTLAIDIVSAGATAYDGIIELSAIHIPPSPLLEEYYQFPMVEWLKDFTLDIGDGKEPATIKPFDPDMAYRLAEYAQVRGFPVMEDVKEFFGHGWWKYSPDVAARLLEKNGFTRDDDGKWLLPDGTPWKFDIVSDARAASDQFRFGTAVAHEWRKFGIDVTLLPSLIVNDLKSIGDFDVTSDRASAAVLGGHVSIFRSLKEWNSAYQRPLGEVNIGWIARWSDPRMDEVLADLKLTDWGDTDRLVQLSTEGLKILVEEMPSIPLSALPDALAHDTYYWTGWPTSENPYTVPHHHWSTFKYMLPFLEATGR